MDQEFKVSLHLTVDLRLPASNMRLMTKLSPEIGSRYCKLRGCPGPVVTERRVGCFPGARGRWLKRTTSGQHFCNASRRCMEYFRTEMSDCLSETARRCGYHQMRFFLWEVHWIPGGCVTSSGPLPHRWSSDPLHPLWAFLWVGRFLCQQDGQVFPPLSKSTSRLQVLMLYLICPELLFGLFAPLSPMGAVPKCSA